MSPWSLGRAAMRLSAQNAAHTGSQTSIWTILVQFRIGVGDHFLSPPGAQDFGVILLKFHQKWKFGQQKQIQSTWMGADDRGWAPTISDTTILR